MSESAAASIKWTPTQLHLRLRSSLDLWVFAGPTAELKATDRALGVVFVEANGHVWLVPMKDWEMYDRLRKEIDAQPRPDSLAPFSKWSLIEQGLHAMAGGSKSNQTTVNPSEDPLAGAGELPEGPLDPAELQRVHESLLGKCKEMQQVSLGAVTTSCEEDRFDALNLMRRELDLMLTCLRGLVRRGKRVENSFYVSQTTVNAAEQPQPSSTIANGLGGITTP